MRTRARRAGPTVALVAALVAVALSCGAREGSADPTTTGPTSTVAAATTEPRRPVARFQGHSDAAYSRFTNWLCAAGQAAVDTCAVANQDTTVVQADGRSTERPSEPPADAPIDCFFVYGSGLPPSTSSTLSRDTTAEEAVVYEQGARLRELCRVYAPLYRQAALLTDQSVAYGDVHAAFRHYMGQWNGGRKLVLFGQGSGGEHLVRLLQEEFDGDEELRGLLVSAFLIGARVDTAPGSRTGGTFRTIPTCAAATDTGCVVAWTTTSPSTPRDVAGRWGEAGPGRSRACVNPANPAGGPGLLTPIIPTRDQGQTSAELATPFLELPELLTAECVTTGRTTTLVVRPAPGNDARNPGALIAGVPTWGLHLVEVSLALGTILDLIAGQTGAAQQAPPPP